MTPFQLIPNVFGTHGYAEFLRCFFDLSDTFNGHPMAEDVFQVLVVDNDPDVREMLQLLVTNMGYNAFRDREGQGCAILHRKRKS